ncbi:hypothetical protein GS575_33085 [Rhodococcus hoagii]|nr:hypothetical protein [Prescottella equi]
MDTDLIEQTVVVTATIAQEADGHTNTVDLEAHLDGDGCVLPPVWRRVSLPHRPTREWSTDIADRGLAGHGYRRTDELLDDDSGCWTATVEHIASAS